MNKLLCTFIQIEKGLQIISLIGIVLLVAYLKMPNFQQEQKIPKSNVSLTVPSQVKGG